MRKNIVVKYNSDASICIHGATECQRLRPYTGVAQVTCVFAGNDEKTFITQFMKKHRCYEVMPSSSKLILFDINLEVNSMPCC